jgi:GTPase SAR1 family protein
MATLRCPVVLIGDCTVGKSACLAVFHKGKQFPKSYLMTSGVDLTVKSIKIPDSQPEANVELYLFDTCGSSIYNPIRAQYYESCSYLVAVFDCTQRSSFTNLSQFISDCKKIIAHNRNSSPATRKSAKSSENKHPESESEDFWGCLVMNKIDLRDAGVIQTSEAAAFAAKNGLAYFEVSALSGENIDAPFNLIAQAHYNKYNQSINQFSSAQ